MKITAIVLSVLIVVSSLSVWVYAKKDNGFDPFGANDIVQNIKNMELNMTSVVLLRTAKASGKSINACTVRKTVYG
jgi:hypothetical protein